MKNKRAEYRSDRADAFVAEPETKEGPVPDDLAEYLGERFVSSATGSDDSDANLQDEIDIEELGGPFIETDAGIELALSNDGDGAQAEAFPAAVRGDRVSPIVRHRH